MNYIDIVVILIMALCVLNSYKKGLVISLFNLVSWIVGLALTNFLYPYVSKFLRESFFYENLKKSLIDSMGFSETIKELTIKSQNDFIQALNIPDFIKLPLLENNNSEIYKVLNVSSIEDYIAGYISNIIINAASMIVVFLLVMMILRVIVVSLNIITKLPIINGMNKMGGAIVGLLQGTLTIWVIMIVLTLLCARPPYQIFDDINASILGIHFYNNNMLMDFILKIVA